MYKNLFQKKGVRIAAWAVVIVAVGLFIWLTAPRSAPKTAPGEATGAPEQMGAGRQEAPSANANQPATKPAAKKQAPKPAGFTEKKTPHFVSANIANNETIAQVPSYLTLSFDANLEKSTQTVLTVKKNDITDATASTSSINENKLVVRLNTQVADGDYYVYYVACFADTGCKDGRFGYRLKLP